MAWPLTLTLWLQHTPAWWHGVMAFFSFLGTEDFYLLLLPLLYWSLDAGLGLRLALMLMTSTGLNSILKMALHTPRPYWVSPDVRPAAAETSFGMPSGHAQNAVAFWGEFARWLGKPWGWALAAGLALLIGLSRVVLGVHFPQDVLVGWVVGLVWLVIFARLEPAAVAWWHRQSLGRRILAAWGVSMAVLLPAVVVGFMVARSWALPPSWETLALASAGEPIAPLSLHTALAVAGTLFGLLAGVALWPTLPRSPRQPIIRLLRFVVGMVGLMVLFGGLKGLLPSGDHLLAEVARYGRYAVVGAWITAGAPWLFRLLRLDDRASFQT